MSVIKHRAPNGALRPVNLGPIRFLRVIVIKHRAPNGALRHELFGGVHGYILSLCHKAPSAKRCIKTVSDERSSPAR